MISFFWIFATIPILSAKSMNREEDLMNFRILHMNDIHSRFDQVSAYGKKCSLYEDFTKRCYGGFPRIATAVQRERDRAAKESVPLLFVFAGDIFQGSMWYTVFKYEVALEFMNALKFDVTTIGNHEFDDGVDNLAEYVNGLNSTVVLTNVNVDEEPTLEKIQKSVIIDLEGLTIGVVGYVTPKTMNHSRPGKVKFYDEVSAVKAEVTKLKSEGVKCIIALGHSGYDADLKMVKLIPEIDIVVGGHSHTFLHKGTPSEGQEIPSGTYPTIVNRKSGRKAAVVQAFHYTKYIGMLDVTVTTEGVIHSAVGKPLLLDHKIDKDSDLQYTLEEWHTKMKNFVLTEVGFTKVDLDSSMCKMGECNYGNLIADAMVYYVTKHVDADGWSAASVAVMSGAAIRDSMLINQTAGIVSIEDIFYALPYRDDVVILNIEGKYLLEAIEIGLKKTGRNFLQVSGLKIMYNSTMPDGQKVKSIKVLCNECDVPYYQRLNKNTSYSIIIPAYLASGGGEFHIFRERGVIVQKVDKRDADIVCEYFKSIGLVYPSIEGRIVDVMQQTKR